MRKILLLLTMSCMALALKAQSVKQPAVMFRGKIFFDRTMNMHAQIDDMSKGNDNSFMAQMKKRVDKYKVDKFELDFTTEKSLYKPAKDGISETKMMWGKAPAEANEVFTDFKNNRFVSKKEVYDKKLFVKDSIIDYKWKIKSEFRTIAGYNCRRAETIIMDSVWVVAFYADGIITPGGPETFNGLPGMVLGVVMPRLNVTYFATEVQNYTNEAKQLEEPKGKGKEYTSASLDEYLVSNMKQWGKYIQRILWFTKI